MIKIIGRNFQEAEIQEHMLDSMISSNKIVAFSRADGWTVIGRDAVRRENSFYAGEERRRTISGPGFSMK
jgi:hypothetical protein